MAANQGTSSRHTQAVVVIHGIGEERPMDTIRSFVQAVLPEPEQGGEKYFSKPDPLSESFELRKLQNRSQPRTHFYEYYWAYKVEGTKFAHVWSWFSGLLFRKPGRVPRQLQPLWVLSWVLLLIFLVAGAVGLFNRPASFARQLAVPPFAVSLASAALLSVVHLVVLGYMGDAARYLSPAPDNIRLRQEIRADGVALLRKLHESGDYERVVVVGHSLGSVIAYDILKNFWEECYDTYATPAASTQPALARLEDLGERLRSGDPTASLQDYMDAQLSLWKELRSLGNPWLVTDLITLGSPLAHAALLLADDLPDLRSRQRQRELPTDPPDPEVEKVAGGQRNCYSYRVWDGYGPQQDIKLRAVHYGGLFAFTRWTNLYFPASAGLFGDIVGGPLAPWFGPGIRDIAVSTSNNFRDHTVGAHTTYWLTASPAKPSVASASSPALTALITALDLGSEESFVPASAAPQAPAVQEAHA